MSENMIKDVIAEYMSVDVPINICEHFTAFLPDNYDEMDSAELYSVIQSDYLINEMVEDVDAINKEIGLILDGESFRFSVVSCRFEHEDGYYILKIQNDENFTKYRVKYKADKASYKIKHIETYI